MEKKQEDNSYHKLNLNWYPGHMVKTKKQIKEDLKLIDVVVELLDARIPLSSQNPDIKEIIGSKKKVIALNKCDLSDEKENAKWVEFFKKNGITAVLTDSKSGSGINNILREIERTVKDEMQQYADKGRTGKKIRILVLGIPNVGKSSFINRLAKKTSANVGNKPGVTKQKQWIRVDNNIELLDTPGILWPKFESEEVSLNLSFTGTIKDEILPKTEIAFALLKILLENYNEKLIERYKLNAEEVQEILNNKNQAENENIYNIMKMIGKKRGTIVSGGNIDDEKVSNIILEDFRSGKIGRISIEKAKI